MVDQMGGKPLRADAQRNREQVLRTAVEVFATEGLSVPVAEIARRAGVGTGTVSRHFPTKEDLFAAVLLDRIRELIEYADTLDADGDPAGAFAALFSRLVAEGSAHRGLAEALAGSGFDIEAAAGALGWDVSGRLRDLLAAGQRAGVIRGDAGYPEVKALLSGCLAADGQDSGRVVDIVMRGLQA